MTNLSTQPNILLIVADDHAPAAFSAYGSQINETPNLDRIGAEGLRLEQCFCTNAICTPARASILTGKYSHRNGVKTLDDTIDQTKQITLPMRLQAAGYQTAMIGKWHLGHGGASDPAGFDDWSVLPVQGSYVDPELIEADGRKRYDGYVTDIVTDLCLDWLENRAADSPFFLMCAHKAPHDPFTPHERYLDRFQDNLPEPNTFDDDYATRPAAAMATELVALMHHKHHVPDPPPPGLTPNELKSWNYQSFIKNYLRCVAAIDDNVGRLLDYLDQAGVSDETIVIYTGDHGFFLGDHGFYDKRFMYEQSIRIPFLMRYPPAIPPGTVRDQIVLNVDFAPTLLDYCGLPSADDIQGRSIRPLLEEGAPTGWRTAMYYRYWMHLTHFNVPAHYGIRTERYKLICYYGEALGSTGAIDRSTPPTWELFDLESDPDELHNVYDDPAYADIVRLLKAELDRQQQEVGDVPVRSNS